MCVGQVDSVELVPPFYVQEQCYVHARREECLKTWHRAVPSDLEHIRGSEFAACPACFNSVFFLKSLCPCLVFNRIALSVCELKLTVRRSNIEKWQYLLALKTSVILFPGIKCHDISSFTCLTCTLVFFVSILGSLLTCRAVCLLYLSVKHSHVLSSVSALRE